MSARRVFAPLVLAAVVAAGCSGGSPPSSVIGTRATGGGIQVLVPPGWTSKEVPGRGFVVAADAADLEADVPAGPRMVASLAPVEPANPSELFAELHSADPAVGGEPEPVTVDGNEGVALERTEVRGGVAIVSREVDVGLDTGEAYLLIAEAPQTLFEANRDTLESILASVRFVPGVPTASPTVPVSPSSTPTESPTLPIQGGTCGEQPGGSDQASPDFLSIEFQQGPGFDRVVFHFAAGGAESPHYLVKFADEMTNDPSGEVVDPDGPVDVEVTFTADESTYTGETDLHPGFATLLEVETLGGSDGLVGWGIGLASKACPRVTATPTDLTIDFPTA
jgi:hypothetical protein